VDLDGGPLSLEAVEAVARRGEEARLAPGAARALAAALRFVDQLAEGAASIYGITTGVGKLKDVVIPPAERAELQRNLVLSHAGGVGAPLSEEEVRAVVLLLAASLARGASGVRPAVVETLIACLNRRVYPVVPEQGSVGSSGDLVPLAHVAACLIGEGDAWLDGRRAPAREALARAGLAPLVLEAKEGLALLNGTHLMTALAALAVTDTARLVRLADVAGAREALASAGAVVARELGSVSDNPLVFPADGAVLSGGNFHGQVLGLVLDTLAIGLAQLGGIAERRVDRLVNPLTSEGLPPFLSPHGGVHSGYLLAQYVAAALVAELRTLAHPASVDSIPTSGLQE